jgi:hypothetical protein
MIPPTPNSVEMHGNNGQFYAHSDPQQQAIYERYRMQVKDQDVSLLPVLGPVRSLTLNSDGIHTSRVPRSYPS